MENARSNIWHSALKIILSTLLCVACFPAQAMVGPGVAFADETPARDFYETVYKKNNVYTLVLQEDQAADKSFGKMVKQKPVYDYDGEWYEVSVDEDGPRLEKAGFHEVSDYPIKRIVVRDRIQAPVDCFLLFSWDNVVSMDLSGLDTSRVRSMEAMFADCYKLRSLDLSEFDTRKVKTMESMFCNCYNLRSLDMSGFDTRNVTNMSDMFNSCIGLRSLDLSGFDTSSVTDMSFMFYFCQDLTTLDLSGFDTRKVKTMKEMFSGSCIRSLDLSSFTFPKGNYSEFVDDAHLFSVKLPKKQAAFFGKKVLKRCHPYFNHDNLKTYSTGKWLNSKNKLFSPSKIPNKTDTYRQQLIFANAPLNMASQEYTGKEIRPALRLNRYPPYYNLKKGLDYTVTFKNNKNVGTATAVVKGKGHIGKKTIKFKINPKGVKATSAKAMKKGLKLTWKKPSKKARSQIDGYQVRCSTKSNMKGAKTLKVKGASKTSAKVSKLKGGKTYYVQVRSYKKAGGKTYYSGWSKAKTVKTKK